MLKGCQILFFWANRGLSMSTPLSSHLPHSPFLQKSNFIPYLISPISFFRSTPLFPICHIPYFFIVGVALFLLGNGREAWLGPLNSGHGGAIGWGQGAWLVRGSCFGGGDGASRVGGDCSVLNRDTWWSLRCGSRMTWWLGGRVQGRKVMEVRRCTWWSSARQGFEMGGDVIVGDERCHLQSRVEEWGQSGCLWLWFWLGCSFFLFLFFKKKKLLLVLCFIIDLGDGFLGQWKF